jgi:hypothetical protein
MRILNIAAALRKSSNKNPALKAGENTAAVLRKCSNKNSALKAGANSAAALRRSSNENPACFESWSELSCSLEKIF